MKQLKELIKGEIRKQLNEIKINDPTIPTLNQMYSLAKSIIKDLEQLSKMVDINENSGKTNNLEELNNIPDEQYKELRYIVSYLDDFKENLNTLPNYGPG